MLAVSVGLAAGALVAISAPAGAAAGWGTLPSPSPSGSTGTTLSELRGHRVPEPEELLCRRELHRRIVPAHAGRALEREQLGDHAQSQPQ